LWKIVLRRRIAWKKKRLSSTKNRCERPRVFLHISCSWFMLLLIRYCSSEDNPFAT
jgi:hypothetical protein